MTLPAVVAALLVLTALHLAFWAWRLRAPTREDEVVPAPTEDGWTLYLGRRRPRAPRRAPPVLLVHGIAMNREAMAKMRAPTKLEIVPGATHLFEEPGTLEKAANLAKEWFLRYLR